MKLKEQIAFLRKEKGITQEELATVFGVSNQAVSKWEAGLCCPDIQLLPELARYFDVSVDQLLGCHSAVSAEDLALHVRSVAAELSKDDAFVMIRQVVCMLHALVVSRVLSEDGNHPMEWKTDRMLETAKNGAWGETLINLSSVITQMRGGAVFFSDTKPLGRSGRAVRALCDMLSPLTDANNLQILFAIYDLTLSDDTLYADVVSIEANCGVADVSARIDTVLYRYLQDKIVDGVRQYRLAETYVPLIPMLGSFWFE